MTDEVTETYRQMAKDLPKPEEQPKTIGESEGFDRLIDGDFGYSEQKLAEEREREERREHARIQQRFSRLICDLGRFSESRLENYDATESTQKRVLKEMESFAAAKWNATRRGLCLFGSVGTGKDHLITSVAKRIAAQGVSVRYFIAEDFYAECSDRFNSGQTEKQFFSKYTEPDICIFSDPIKKKWLGEFAPDAGHERFCAIVKKRAQQKKPTWVTANLFEKDLDAGLKRLGKIFGSDVVRRLTDNAVIGWCNWKCYTKAAKVIR